MPYLFLVIKMRLRELLETATAGATSAGNIATVIGPDRHKKSYTGSPGKSGTKAPKLPKIVQKKNKDGTAKNAQDYAGNLFGEDIIKRYK